MIVRFLVAAGIEMPVDLQAEQAVLGASLIDQSAYEASADILQGGNLATKDMHGYTERCVVSAMRNSLLI